MTTGQINFYHFDFQNANGERAVDGVEFQTNRSNVLGNRINLLIPASDSIEASWVPLHKYATTRLHYLGELFVQHQAPRRKISFNTPQDARPVIESLHQHGDISDGDRAEIAEALLELEKCIQYAEDRLNVISVAQKDIIKDFVTPYVEIIRAETTDIQILKEWLSCARMGLEWIHPHHSGSVIARLIAPSEELNPSLGRDHMISRFVAHQCDLQGKSQEFFQSLIALAKAYYGKADLEDTLEQLGEGIPSQELIQQNILELFN